MGAPRHPLPSPSCHGYHRALMDKRSTTTGTIAIRFNVETRQCRTPHAVPTGLPYQCPPYQVHLHSLHLSSALVHHDIGLSLVGRYLRQVPVSRYLASTRQHRLRLVQRVPAPWTSPCIHPTALSVSPSRPTVTRWFLPERQLAGLRRRAAEDGVDGCCHRVCLESSLWG